MRMPLRVLLVEDSLADAELELAELRRGGYDPDFERVDTPEDMKAALADGAWDVILSDYVMPRFSGPAALKLLQESGLDLPFIMVTGQVGEATAIDTLTAGAHDYVMKGSLARLVPAVQRVLQDAVLRRERRGAEEALRKAHEELRLAHAELERRVDDRTAELQRVNEELQNEIVKRKQAEEVVHRAAAFYEAAMKSLGEGLYTVDEKGLVTFMNPASEQLFGWSSAELRGKKMHDMTHHHYPDGRPFPASECAGFQVLSNGRQLVNHEDVFIRKDGTFFPVIYSISPMCDDTGKITGLVVVFRDITERKRAEALLSRNQKTFSELVERAPFGIYVVDSQLRIAQMNAVSQNGAFRNVRPVVGRDFAEAMRIIWPEPVASDLIAVFRHTLETGEPYYSPHFTNPRHDVATVESYEWELHRMTLPDGQYGAICYYFDSTRLREAEDERERLLREVEARQVLLQAVIENAPVGIAVLRGPSFIFDLANPAYQAIAPGKALIGRTVAESWPELAPQVVPLLERVYHTGEPYRTVEAPLSVQRSPGGPIEAAYFTFAYIPLRRPDEQIDTILVLVIETTEQVHARQ